MTGAGGLWFAWLATQWSRNLFVAMTAHMLMDRTGQWYAGSDHAGGSIWFEVGRAATITLGTFMTSFPRPFKMDWAREGPGGQWLTESAA